MTTKAEMLKDIEYTEAKLIDNNTVRYTCPNGDVVIRLHLTDILIFRKDGSITFNSDDYQTVTTKNRMNEYQDIGRVFQKDYAWYIMVDETCYDYFDGITFKDGKELKK